MTYSLLFHTLQVYHTAASILAALCAIMTMQAVGHTWPQARFDQAIHWAQRAGLGGLSVALFCSAVRLPYLPDVEFSALLSGAAVNSSILAVLAPTALLGKARTHWLWGY